MPTQNKLTPIVSLTGINTVGIYTVGITELAGGGGVSSTTYLRSVLMHNTGLGTCTSSLYIYPHWEEVEGIGKTAYKLLKKSLESGETYLWDLPSYPILMMDREKVVVEINSPTTIDQTFTLNTAISAGSTAGIGTTEFTLNSITGIGIGDSITVGAAITDAPVTQVFTATNKVKIGLALTAGESIYAGTAVTVTGPNIVTNGTGIGSAVNYVLFGDLDSAWA
jgi:hypothetical protein